MESKNGTGKKVYLYETVADAIETDLLNGTFDKRTSAINTAVATINPGILRNTNSETTYTTVASNFVRGSILWITESAG